MRKLEAMLLARVFKAKAEYWRAVAHKLYEDLPDEERAASWDVAVAGERALEVGILGANAALIDSSLDDAN